MIKTTGAEWHRFMADKDIWGESSHYYYDDLETLEVNGQDILGADDYDMDAIPSDARVTFVGGVLCYQGNNPDSKTETRYDGMGLERAFRRWRKAQTTTTLLVECPNDMRESIVAAIRAAGGRVT